MFGACCVLKDGKPNTSKGLPSVVLTCHFDMMFCRVKRTRQGMSDQHMCSVLGARCSADKKPSTKA